jgi:hypothetical protein
MMNNEILLRAWDKQRREYLSGGEVLIAIQPGKDPKNIVYLDILKNPDMYKDRFELERYIGKNDKNGDRIFTGDVLRKDGYWSLVAESERIMPLNMVQYNNSKGVSLNQFDSTDWEIKGNIHDDPQLLADRADGN